MPLHRPALVGLAFCVLLGGCADKAAKPTRPASHAGHGQPATIREAGSATAAGEEGALPAKTGIAACDDYLASYRACHRAAAIFAPDQIESHYQQMRQSLLRDSLRPEIRPQLATRCNSLAGTLRQALHGKTCGPDPATGGSAATP